MLLFKDSPEQTREPAPDHEAPTSEKELKDFVEDAKKRDGVFHLDKSLSIEQLETKLGELEGLIEEFEKGDTQKRTELEGRVLDSVPEIPPQAQDFLDSLHLMPTKEGAENKSYFLSDKESGEERVVKLSKSRHDADFGSVLKLMRNMFALELFQKKQEAGEFMSLQDGNMKLEVLFDSITIYRDKAGNYKRLIEQPFAEGKPIKEKVQEAGDDIEFQKAWKKFLEQMGLLQAVSEVVLDLTDSTQGARPSRGDVSKTENVFVKDPEESDGNYVFQIIDLDVFDAPLMDTKQEKGAQHKFYPKEQLRKAQSVLQALKVLATNISRDSYVSKMQERYVDDEMNK